MLLVEDLHVRVGGKEVLKGVNLTIPSGEIHLLFGPNGSGKTTLLMSIMGFEGYVVTRGRILYKGIDITGLPVYERARLGIGISFQRPPTIKGVKLRDLVKLVGKDGERVERISRELGLFEFMERGVNEGFSGGEIKRSELLQLFAQDPELVLLDEPESGVDVENISILGRMISRLLGVHLEDDEEHKKGKSLLEIKKKKRKTALIISHTGFILDYVPADKGHLLLDGRIVCEGNPVEMFETIREHGYEECMRCARRMG